MTEPADRPEGSPLGRRRSEPAGDPLGNRARADDPTLFWELAPAMLAIADYDGYLELVNPAFREALRWSENELKSVPIWVFIHPDDQHRAVEIVERSRHRDAAERSTLELRMLCRNGRYRRIRWIFRPVPQHEVRYWIGDTLDDTTTPDPGGPALVGTFRWDIATDVLDWSEEVYRMFDLPIGSPVTYPEFLGVIHAEDRSTVDDDIRRSLETGEEFFADFRVVQMDGHVRWLRCAGRVIDDQAGGPHMFGVALDITERRERGLP